MFESALCLGIVGGYQDTLLITDHSGAGWQMPCDMRPAYLIQLLKSYEHGIDLLGFVCGCIAGSAGIRFG